MNIGAVLVVGAVILVVYVIWHEWSDRPLVIKKREYLENLLREKLAARGNGLGELISSASNHLPPQTIQQLREIHQMIIQVDPGGRNKLRNRARFRQLCNRVERELGKHRTVNPRPSSLLLYVIISVMVIAGYFFAQNLP